jgi:protein TonB
LLNPLRRLKREHLIGLMFVLALHSVALYGLWSYRIIPTPEEAVTLMVNLISPPPAEKPKPPKPKPETPKPRLPDPPPPEHIHLAVEIPVVLPDDHVVYVPPPPPPPPPVVEAPTLPPQPVTLSSELSVSCPERTPPVYPSISIRMNEQGKVVLKVELGEDGRVARLEVKSSSGYQRLDTAALSAVKTWRCKPAIRNGMAVHAIALQPFNFILEGR